MAWLGPHNYEMTSRDLWSGHQSTSMAQKEEIDLSSTGCKMWDIGPDSIANDVLYVAILIILYVHVRYTSIGIWTWGRTWQKDRRKEYSWLFEFRRSFLSCNERFYYNSSKKKISSHCRLALKSFMQHIYDCWSEYDLSGLANFDFWVVAHFSVIIFAEMTPNWRQPVGYVDLNVSQGIVFFIYPWKLIFPVFRIS